MQKVKNIFKFVGLILLVMTINIIPMILIGQQSKIPITMRWLSSIAYLIIAYGLVYLIWKRYRKDDPSRLSKVRFTWKDFGIAFLFFLATRLVAILGTLLIQVITGNPMSANDAALTATNAQLANMFPLYFVCFHVAIGLFAPIMEELVFRGFYSRYFFKPNQKWVKLIVSSSIFALLHIKYPIEFVTYFALGSIFYLAFARRGNIVDSIVVHILNNSLIVILSVISYLMILFG